LATPPDKSNHHSGPPPADGSEEEDLVFDQADLDALLEAVDDDGSAEVAAASEDIDQDLPEPDATPSDSGPTDQPTVDELLDGGDADQVLDGSDLEAILGAAEPSTGADEDVLAGTAATVPEIPLAHEASETDVQADTDAMAEEPETRGESGIDDSLAAAAAENAADAESTVEPYVDASIPAGGDSGASAQAEIDAPEPEAATDTAFEAEEKAKRVASENLAAAAEEERGLLSQDVVDGLLQDYKGKEAKQTETERAVRAPSTRVPEVEEAARPGEPELPEAEPAEDETRPKTRKPTRPNIVVAVLRQDAPKAAFSLAAGLTVCIGTFLYLLANPEREPGGRLAAISEIGQLTQAIENAGNLVELGEYFKAIEALDAAIAETPPSSERIEAEFIRIEALYKTLPAKPSQLEAERIHGEIDRLVEAARLHPRIPEVLRWKGDVYEREDNLFAARGVYSRILNNYVSAPDLDKVLMAAAKTALQLDRPDEAADHMRRLIEQMPGSPLVGEAKLVLGDAYIGAGKAEDARRLYEQIARLQFDTPLGAAAYTRLGRLAYDRGHYTEAIERLNARFETAVIEDNDQVYLLLAQAYRANGQLQEAADILRELIDFFPESDVTPLAFVELSQVLDELGHRKEAVRLAAQKTLQDYPNHPEVLKNAGQLLLVAGNVYEAAHALVAADQAGGNDPALLLAAGRHFRDAGAFEEAIDALERATEMFPTTPEAFEAAIELAEVHCKMGQVRTAVKKLEDLALATEGRPRRLPVLVALAELYDDLGFRARAAQVYGQIAAVTAEPEMLAQSAVALFRGGAPDDALAVAERIDLSRIKDETAYALLMEHGKALLVINSNEAVRKMEHAYREYPTQRTAEGDFALLDAYLVKGRTARARELVMGLEAQVRLDPGDAPHLERAALAWGDYLYQRRDFRDAANAYAIAVNAGQDSSRNNMWAKYQRANAFLQVSDFEGSIPLFDEVAGATVPWAREAAAKADYARLEQRLRGMEVTPRPQEEG